MHGEQRLKYTDTLMRRRGTGEERGGKRTGEITRGKAQRRKHGGNNTDRQRETNKQGGRGEDRRKNMAETLQRQKRHKRA